MYFSRGFASRAVALFGCGLFFGLAAVASAGGPALGGGNDGCQCSFGAVTCASPYFLVVHTPARDQATGSQIAWRNLPLGNQWLHVPLYFRAQYCQPGEAGACLNCEYVYGYVDHDGVVQRIGSWPPVLPGCTEMAQVVEQFLFSTNNANVLSPPCPPNFNLDTGFSSNDCFADSDHHLMFAPQIGTFMTPLKYFHGVELWTQHAGAQVNGDADDPAVFLQGGFPALNPPPHASDICPREDMFTLWPDPSIKLPVGRCDFAPVSLQTEACLVVDFVAGPTP